MGDCMSCMKTSYLLLNELCHICICLFYSRYLEAKFSYTSGLWETSLDTSAEKISGQQCVFIFSHYCEIFRIELWGILDLCLSHGCYFPLEQKKSCLIALFKGFSYSNLVAVEPDSICVYLRKKGKQAGGRIALWFIPKTLLFLH